MTTSLVIEDHDTLRNQIIQVLQLTQYEVIGASDGQRGLEMVQEYKPDLILCDIMMENVNGYQVLQQLRSDPSTATTPFIFLTVKDDRNSMRTGMSLGADDYITKPFTSSELLNAINTRL